MTKKDSTAAARKRKLERARRAKKAEQPDVKLVAGKTFPDAPAGMVPATISRRNGRTTITFENPLEHLKATVFTWDEADRTGLALHLANELRCFGQGRSGESPEEFDPVLKAYVKILRARHAREVALSLAYAACCLSLGKCEAAWVHNVARQLGRGTSLASLEKVAASRAKPLKKATTIYDLIARGSVADPPPQARADRGGKLAELLNKTLNLIEIEAQCFEAVPPAHWGSFARANGAIPR